MISEKQYRAAVEVFNKSVKVLEKHSHVLSFKNILERTQIMMTDLRGKVRATYANITQRGIAANRMLSFDTGFNRT